MVKHVSSVISFSRTTLSEGEVLEVEASSEPRGSSSQYEGQCRKGRAGSLGNHDESLKDEERRRRRCVKVHGRRWPDQSDNTGKNYGE